MPIFGEILPAEGLSPEQYRLLGEAISRWYETHAESIWIEEEALQGLMLGSPPAPACLRYSCSQGVDLELVRNLLTDSVARTVPFALRGSAGKATVDSLVRYIPDELVEDVIIDRVSRKEPGGSVMRPCCRSPRPPTGKHRRPFLA